MHNTYLFNKIERIMRTMKKYFGNKQFYKSVFMLIIPIMIQQLFISIAGYIDNIMINSFGGNALAYNGVNAANRLMFVCNFLWLGVAATVSIFISQYYGANNESKASESLRLGLIMASIFGILSFIVCYFFGNTIVDMYVQDPTSRQYGYDYIQTIKHACIITSINMMIASGFRSVNKPKYALISAIIGILVNISLNYILIFGHFGFEAMGAKGAALATLLSRIVETIFNVIFIFAPKQSFFKGLFKELHIDSYLVKDSLRRGIPLICNEILWSLGMVLLAMFYTWKNDIWYNAYGYSQNISDLFFIVFSGLGNGTGVFIGACLGRGDFEEAEREANYFKGLAIIMGITVGILMVITAPVITDLFNPTDEVRKITINFLRITGFFTGVYCYNSVCFFTLRSGGDSVRAFILDQSPTYFICLPLAIILGVNAKKWGIDVILIYIITHAGDVVKMFIANLFLKKKKWLRNLTIQAN